MAVSYTKLWKLLIDKKMSKADLRKTSGISPNTMTKLRRDETVMFNVLDKPEMAQLLKALAQTL